MSDPVNAPDHYRAGGIEAIEVIEAFGLGFHLGNVVKYVLRAGRKGDRLEDLKKARWYLDRAIDARGVIEDRVTPGGLRTERGRKTDEREIQDAATSSPPAP